MASICASCQPQTSPSRLEMSTTDLLEDRGARDLEAGNPPMGQSPQADGSGIGAIFRQSSHPTALFFLFFFRSAAIATYLLCGFFSNSYVFSTVIVVVLLSADFWTVRNVSGRVLVGLRFWNQVDDDGSSYWVFESRDPSHPVNAVDSRLFWLSMYTFPLAWIALLIVGFIKFNVSFIPIVILALVFNITNTIGFSYADRDARERWASGMSASGMLGQFGGVGGSVVSGLFRSGMGKVFRNISMTSSAWCCFHVASLQGVCRLIPLPRVGPPKTMPRANSTVPDYYGILGVDPSASASDIRMAYKKKSLSSHPDMVQGDAAAKKKATDEFQKVADAYYVLSDSERRSSYDRLRGQRQSMPGGSDFFQSFGNEHPDPEETFGDVFEDMLRPEVQRAAPLWTWIGASAGAAIGFIAGNLPGAALGGYGGSRLGAIRDAKGKAVYEVFQEMGGEQKAQILRALAFKVLGSGSI